MHTVQQMYRIKNSEIMKEKSSFKECISYTKKRDKSMINIFHRCIYISYKSIIFNSRLQLLWLEGMCNSIYIIYLTTY